MQFAIEKQFVVIEDKVYSPSTIERHCQELRETDNVALQDVALFLREWFSCSHTVEVQTSGSTGTPKRMQVAKERMMQSARMTCIHLRLSPKDKALLCMNMQYIGAKMMVVRALLLGMTLVVRTASGHPLVGVEEAITFAAMAPLQVHNSLSNNRECNRLRAIDKLLIGGGSLDSSVERALASFPGEIYATYGMTETLSHIALRRINGREASPFYTPLEGVSLTLSENDTVCIEAPFLCQEPVKTNDIVRLNHDGTFALLGRVDNVINSGGIKIFAEEVEGMLSLYIATPLAVASIPDKALGEALVLLVETDLPEAEIATLVSEHLPPYKRPKRILRTRLPLTANGKIDRKALRQEALRLCFSPDTSFE